ncbi:MAG: ABC transporter ATP-binding protein [Cytophagales bacterium]|nr:ABC transporter ATP-binding protein [Cytophagales bacterium]
MSDVVLKVESLYKRYRLGTVDASTFVEDLQRLWAKIRGKPDPFEKYITSNELSAIKTPEEMKRLKARYVWALQDINFEVKRGEIVGIIGKNGAGKSTLLKILSKTTAPTRGQVKIKGRVASLLEVGTGFHPELTGRENIYLNGHILGMTRHEVRSRLDEIVDFAGVEAYLDTPVKRYSSGMYVRLAFAVAAHLLADILIVDEVLAVGDAEFQKKCIGKMKDVSTGEGRTVLFVSHNMGTVQKLCTHGILLKNGKISLKQSISSFIQEYLFSYKLPAIKNFQLPETLSKQELLAHAYRIQIENEAGKIISEIPVGAKWRVRIFIQVFQPVEYLIIGLGMQSLTGFPIRTTWSQPQKMVEGKYEIIFSEEQLVFAPGTYNFILGISENLRALQYEEDAVQLTISEVLSINDNRILNTASGLILNPTSNKITRISE